MNYATLTQAISDWLNKDNIDKVLPMIVRFAQRSLEDGLRLRAMEYTPANETIAAGTSYLTVPSDYLELKYLALIKDSIRYTIVGRRDIYVMRSIATDTTETGIPEEIARQGDNLYFDVTTDEEYTREWCYYRRLPQLVAAAPNNTNWWSENAEEAFLMCCLDKSSKYISGIQEEDKRKWAEAAIATRETLRLNELSEQASGILVRTAPWI